VFSLLELKIRLHWLGRNKISNSKRLKKSAFYLDIKSYKEFQVLLEIVFWKNLVISCANSGQAWNLRFFG
jgi:hypothetical protein